MPRIEVIEIQTPGLRGEVDVTAASIQSALGYEPLGGSTGLPMSTPVAPTLVASTTGGSLASGTYYYKVVAVDPNGGLTLASPEASVAVTGPTGSVRVNWTPVRGSVDYRIYRGTSSGGQDTWFLALEEEYFDDIGGTGTAGTVPTTASAYSSRITPDGDGWLTAHRMAIQHGTINAHEMNNQISPHFIALAVGGDYTTSDFTDQYQVYQVASNVRNRAGGVDATDVHRATAIYGGGRAEGAHSRIWGGNFFGAAYADGAHGNGIEVNAGVYRTGGTAISILSVLSGSYPSMAHIWTQVQDAAAVPPRGLVFSNKDGVEPVTGSLIATVNAPNVPTGIDFAGGTFTTSLIDAPNNAPIRMKDGAGNLRKLLNVEASGYAVLGDNSGYAGLVVRPGGGEAMRFRPDGMIGVGLTSGIAAQMHARSVLASRPAVIAQGAASQTANIAEWRDSADVVLASIGPSGTYRGAVRKAPERTASLSDDFLRGSTSNSLIGELGWFTDNTGASAASVSVAGHPGIIHRSTGATAGTYAYTRLISHATGQVVPAENFDATFVFRLNQNDTDTLCRVGLAADTAANPPANGFYLEKLGADTNWHVVTRNADTETRSGLTAVSAGAWVKVRLRRINSTTLGITINEGTEAQITTNIPTATLNPFFAVHTAVAAAKSVEVDWFDLLITQLSR